MSLKQRARQYATEHGCGYQKALSIVREPVLFPLNQLTVGDARVAVELNPASPHLLLLGRDAQEVIEATMHDDIALPDIDPVHDLRPVEWTPFAVASHVHRVRTAIEGTLGRSGTLAELRHAQRAAGMPTTPYMRFSVPDAWTVSEFDLTSLAFVLANGAEHGVQVLVGARSREMFSAATRSHPRMEGTFGRLLLTDIFGSNGYPGGTPRADFEAMKRDVAEAQRVPGVTLT